MYSLTTVVLIYVVGGVVSIGCPKIEKIVYSPARDTTCGNITGSEEDYFGNCVFETCADLQDHSGYGNFYCGKGSCNPLGNDCEDGCIQLDQWGLSVVTFLEKRYNTTVHLVDLFYIKYARFVDFQTSIVNYAGLLKLSSKVPIGSV